MPQKYELASETSREMLAALKDFKTTALASEARAYERYDLNDDRKITVKAFASDQLKRHFEVGKQAPSFKHAFVKLADDHRVYHSGQNIRRTFEKELDDLRDKSILNIAATDVTEISVTAKNATINFKRQLSQPKTHDKKDAKKDAKKEATPEPAKVTWINPGGPNGDPAKIDKLLTTLADLKCAQFIYDRKKADFSEPAYTLTIKSPKPHTLNLFSEGVKKDNDIPATSSEQNDAFYLQTWKANEIKEAINSILGIKPKEEAKESK